MLTKNQLTAILFIAAALWGALLLLDGVSVDASLLTPFSRVVGILVLLLAAYDRWLWKLPVFARWLAKRPVLQGTWRGVISSRWKDPKTGMTPAPIEAYMVVRQTLSSLSMRLHTAESSSELLGAEISYAPDGTCELSGVYRNEPKAAVLHRSPIHHGGILLRVVGQPATSLKGKYWTDRNSAGDMELVERRSRAAGDFESARTLFGSKLN